MADAAEGLSALFDGAAIFLCFYEWRAMGLWPRINHHLVMEARELEGKEASPTAGAIDRNRRNGSHRTRQQDGADRLEDHGVRRNIQGKIGIRGHDNSCMKIGKELLISIYNPR